MTTLHNDHMRLHLRSGGTARPQLRAYGLEWPPPERICLDPITNPTIREAREGDDEAWIMVRTSYSQLPDDVADHPHVARCAEYHYLSEVPR